MDIKSENYTGFKNWSKQVASWPCVSPIVSIDIDQERSCVWFNVGGENRHLVRYDIFSKMGGWESGHEANAAANPSAFSLEEAKDLYNLLITDKMNNEVKSILTLVALAKKHENSSQNLIK
ncbi:hypothetical protein NOS3756_60440 (plasmid) [Nostoc sp. NIES-3756]|uniref:hypothetical protein n=1 Tax=Nostoc sp. NIES-3756 TaxID=1751286 RepID=UPI00072231B1|nr:hypothetical protein [Nostoc sp. NIES-3756]BAT57032.1 hypothetical protein NOS3756_60440 [Nostoc sp. NIES-3756]